MLSDTKKARQRADEKEATEIITAALLEVRQIYRKSAVGPDPVPEGEHWTGHLLAELGASQAAAMRFHDKALRRRLTVSLDLLLQGSPDSQMVAYEAHRDAMECLGAHIRRERLPKPTRFWTDARDRLEWAEEQARQTREELQARWPPPMRPRRRPWTRPWKGK
ncbi:hypothetical protein [Streptomyces yangpuensis]|uniref:hypothetical protein n=1 Tax=Streptomyces yangpuensis TaxID=1648182 RepID=UPI003658059F